jgi:hypothetical protein
MKHHPHNIARARILNEAAPPVYSRTGPPRPIRANVHPDENGPWHPPLPRPKPKGTLANPDLLAAMAAASSVIDWQDPPPPSWVVAYSTTPAFKGEDVKTFFVPHSPPQFRIPKKGPNAGKPVELKRRVEIITRTVTDGDGVEYSFTNRSSKVRVSSGLTLTPDQVRATFARRWPRRAADLANHLLNF